MTSQRRISRILLSVFIHFASGCYILGQSGFINSINLNTSYNVDIDDVQYVDDQLIVSGNMFIEVDNIGIAGLLVAGMDTNGVVLWQNVLYDTTLATHIIINTPARFLVTEDRKLIFPVIYYNWNKFGVIITDSVGGEIRKRIYDYDGLSIFPFDIVQFGNYYYVLGIVQKANYLLDVFIMKIDTLGNEIWQKSYGLSQYDEFFGDVIKNMDGTFTISSDRSTKKFINDEGSKLTGWKSPWIFTVDTSDVIVDQWIGEQNDAGTLGGGPFHRLPDGGFVVVGRDFKEMPYGISTEVRPSPTVTRFDSDFNLDWKVNLTDFSERFNRLRDMEFDEIRNQIVVTGDKYFWLNSVYMKEIWIVKLDLEGNIIWEVTDTLYRGSQNEHFTAGLALAPSGSIYASGYVISYGQVPEYQGFIMKVSPDGCVDTICTTTSIEEQIRSWDENVVLFPNPAADEINLRIKALEGNGQIRIFDLQGKCLVKDNVEEGNNSITLALAQGIYVYTIEDARGIIFSGKLSLQ